MASGLVLLAQAVVPAVGTTITGVTDYLVLLAPSANRVYTVVARDIAAAELALVSPDATAIEPVTIAGVSYLRYGTEDPDVAALSRLSTLFAVFAVDGDRLRPVEIPRTDVFDDDLVSIPKYQGKTNEQFTRLMVNATLSAVRREPPFSVLDPLCGRGTTLSTVWTLGHDAAGVDIDLKAVEAYATFLTTYLKRKRISHSADLAPVRREGRSLGKRFQVTVRPDDARSQDLTVFTGDARDSAALFGKRTFDAIVTDAPYGVVHGSRTGSAGAAAAGRDRSPAGLLQAAVPLWAGQLRTGGALGIAWNTYGMDRAELSTIASAAGLQPCEQPGYLGFAHRVDSSIRRDLFVARKP